MIIPKKVQYKLREDKMNREIINLLEKARFELPILSTNIPTRKLIGEALDLLLFGEHPLMGEFTKEIRQKVNCTAKVDYLHLGEIANWAVISKDILELCDRLDTAEARLKVLPDLLEACEGLMEKADNGSADFDDPVPGSIYLKAIAAISKAKKGKE